MSKVEVNTIEPQCGTTLTVGKCTTSVAVPGNVVKSNALQASDGGNIVSQSGTDITLGASGDTINLASGASQSGFGRTGTVDWITTPKVTGDSPITGVTGKGYFLNTTAGAITINLPAGAAGSIVSMADYAATWQTNNVTVTPNGSEKIGGTDASATLSTEGQSVTFVYVDSTQGWVNTMDSTSNVRGAPPFIAASGGNTTLTCGDYKTHVFTGPGTLCVSAIGTGPTALIDYLVVAGGGGGGYGDGGGAGAGGFRFANSYAAPGSNTPIVAPTGVPVSVQGYPITVGGGGAGGANPNGLAIKGSNSVFSTLTSTGGGRGSGYSPDPGTSLLGDPGGSGSGAASAPVAVGAGNTPPVSPPQGNNGGAGGSGASGAGGGAGAVGGGSPGPALGGTGGIGAYIADSYIGPTAPSYGTAGPTGSTRYFAGGAGGYGDTTGGSGGSGGGGKAGNPPSYSPAPTAGTVNTGGGGGPGSPVSSGNLGGSGIVIIRYKFQ